MFALQALCAQEIDWAEGWETGFLGRMSVGRIEVVANNDRADTPETMTRLCSTPAHMKIGAKFHGMSGEVTSSWIHSTINIRERELESASVGYQWECSCRRNDDTCDPCTYINSTRT